MKREWKISIVCQNKDRCIILFNNFLNYKFDSSYLLYEDNLSIDEVVRKITTKKNF